MLVSAAVCPHPPAIVPDVSRNGADRLQDVRQASISAVGALVSHPIDVLVGVGAGSVTRRFDATAGASLREFGVAWSAGGEDADLPLSLCIARYLIEAADVRTPLMFVSVAYDESVGNCRAIGAELAAGETRVGLLVMGDGSAKRSKTSPGYLHPDAEGFDTMIAAALRSADPAALLSVEPERAAELWVAGRPGWQVLAGALSDSTPFKGELSYDAAPLGVGYFVATLNRA